MNFGTIPQAIADIKAGKLVVVADDEDRVARFSYSAHGSDAIDVALHDVAAEPVGRLEGALEVYSLARRPIAHCRPAQCSNDRRNREAAIGAIVHGQAGAVDGDAFAILEVVVAR